MATLILTAVGTAVGGPIGGMIGALVGQNLDQAIFAPKARHGPRLGDLAVQTSSYGTAIPKLFGTMRVAGTVIWSTDLIETRSGSGGGKGQPKTVNYSYSASFAVAVSGRPIRSVRRIWADGKLLRGAGGDFKTSTKFRTYLGDEDQDPDPLIASLEGTNLTPAFRGVAYAVFEDFQLADYGNRIPSLTFEVEADAGPVATGSIAETLSGGAVLPGSTPALHGYAATGDSVRSAIEAITSVLSLSMKDTGNALLLGPSQEVLATIDRNEETKRREIIRRAAASVPGEVTIAYYEVERDYQSGLQRAARGGAGARSDRQALAASLTATGAKTAAENRLAALWAGRAQAKTWVSWRRADLRPGSLVSLSGEPGTWRIAAAIFGPMTIGLDLVRIWADRPVAAASSGRAVLQPDQVHGPTLLRLHDLPLGSATAQGAPVLYALAAGSHEGWRQAALEISYDQGSSWAPSGRTAPPAVVGTASTLLAPAGSALFDRRNAVEVDLAHQAMWLESRSEAAIAAGANLALLGKELVQFTSAEALGERSFRLSGLLRGRRGTEWAATGHAVGEHFALLEPEALLAIEAPAGSIGGSARLVAAGIGDQDPAEAELTIDGEALRPPPPVHLKAERSAAGDLAIRWVRRSREGWAWLSGSDTPLGEERESYNLSISGGGGPTRSLSLSEPTYLYTAAEQAADGRTGPIVVRVRQIGTYAGSRDSEITVS